MRIHSPCSFANIKHYTLNHAKTLIHLLRSKMNFTSPSFTLLCPELHYLYVLWVVHFVKGVTKENRHIELS